VLSTDEMRAGRHLFLLSGIVAAFLIFAPGAEAAPANDAFADAVALSPASPGSVLEGNFEASKEADEPSHAGNAGGHSIWYSWTPPSSGPVGISGPCFDSPDALIAVYTGSAVNALTPVGSNQGIPPSGCFGESKEIEFAAGAGVTYWIAIDGRDGAQGFYGFTVNRTPANDDFAAAQAIGAEPPQDISGSVKFAGKESGEPNHAGDPGGHSVWFNWTPSVSGLVDISTCEPFSELDSVLAVYTGSSLGGLTPVAANDDGISPGGFPECRWTDSEVRIDAAAGTTYRIAVDGASGTFGRFNLHLRGRPANDTFASPVVLQPGLPTNSPFGTSTRLATKQVGEPDHAGDLGGHSVWFEWTPSSSGPVAITACGHYGEDLDPLLAVYTGADVAALVPLVANDDAASGQCGPTGSEVRFAAVAGTIYRIAVDGKGGSEGRFDLNLQGGPANDDFANAQSLSAGLPVYSFGSTRLATKQAGEPDHAGDPGGHSVWFSWTASTSGSVDVTVCPYNEIGGETLLAVYTGADVAALTPVASDASGGSGCDPRASEVELTVVAGTTYRIAVDGKGDDGLFDLQIEGSPANDDFAAAEVLSATPMTAGGSTRFAIKQAGEPNHASEPGGHSVWFSWTPSNSGSVDISACGRTAGLDTLLAVYTGSAVNNLTAVASNDDSAGGPANEFCESGQSESEVVFDAVAGTTYRIAVDSKGGQVGRFGLAFERVPANDDFATPGALSPGQPAYGSGVTRLATKQSGEPNHAGDSGGHSVWFEWTPSSSGPVALSTCSNEIGDLDTLLAVYTGSTLGSLAPVASSDDGAAGDCLASDSEVQFNAIGETTYLIAVDGKGGSWGGFQLTLEGVAANDDFSKPHSLGAGLPFMDFGLSNRFATKQAGEPDHAGDPGGHSVWFKWTAPRTGKVSVDTCGSGFDTLLAVYTGAAVESLTPLQSNDDAGGKCTPQSKLSFDAVANTVYKIAVDGKAGAQGAIHLNLDEHPGNDDFESAENIPGSLGWYWSGSTLLATKQAGEPNHGGDPGGHSVWYSWTPSKAAVAEFDSCTTSFAPLLAVYTGNAVSALSPVAGTDAGSGECDEGRSFRFSAVAGTTYRIAVDGAAGDEGHFELHLRPAFALPAVLTISRTGAGAGSVSSSPAGIACGATCSHGFKAGTVVALAASPDSGSTFAGWSGGGCSGTGSCQVTLDTDTVVTANFAFQASGGGSGDKSIDGLGPPNGPARKPLRCKPGFRKVRVHGKAKCVKKRPKHHRHHRSRR
jgi:hypothetical protein